MIVAHNTPNCKKIAKRFERVALDLYDEDRIRRAYIHKSDPDSEWSSIVADVKSRMRGHFIAEDIHMANFEVI